MSLQLSNIEDSKFEKEKDNATARQRKLYIFLKTVTILTNVTIGTIVIYNLYYINRRLVDVKESIDNLF